MTKLGCSVTTCLHNADLLCCKKEIEVEGQDAKTSDCTCCGSFHEKSGDSFKDSSESPNTHLDVKCEAVNCIYNTDRFCQAENIGIAGNGATQAKQTECATFKMR